MPEGPEIRRAADRVAKALVGRRLERVSFAFEELRPFETRFCGRVVESVEPRGKALLTRVGRDLNLYSHNQLYGKWQIVKAGRPLPETQRQLRVALHNAEASALLYSASDIEVLTDAGVREHRFLTKLGPDVLDGAVTVDHVDARLADPRFCRRRITTLLLDQEFVCGLGNYLRSEILFVARIDPGARPADLRDGQRRDLARAILQIARRAYRYAGITVEPDLARELRADGVRRAQLRHYVFSRSRKPCRECGTTIERGDAGGRRIYWCSACQPKVSRS